MLAIRCLRFTVPGRFLDIARKDPAKVGKAIEIAQNLWVEIFFIDNQHRDTSLSPPASCPSEIKRSGNGDRAGNHPIFRIKRSIFFKIDNYRCDSINHFPAG